MQCSIYSHQVAFSVGFIYYFQMDPGFEPHNIESRTIFGLKLEQQRNNAKIDESVFKNIVTKRQDVNDTNTGILIGIL